MNARRAIFVVLTIIAASAGCHNRYRVSGLRPVTPKLYFNEWFGSSYVPVDSLQPTLIWEAFPRPCDITSSNPPGAVTNLTYELRIYHLNNEHQPAYERVGITEPQHMVDTPLAPNTCYRWTVRARYEVDGQPRLTQWSEWCFADSPTPFYSRSGFVHKGEASPSPASGQWFFCFRTPAR